MAVIELAKPGQEATTYELIITVGNAAILLNGVLSTQLLTPMKAAGCDDDSGNCGADTVVVTSKQSFNDSDGPARYTNYTLLLTGISILGAIIFTPFLPKSKEECHEWRDLGEKLGTSLMRGKLSMGLAVVVIGVRS